MTLREILSKSLLLGLLLAALPGWSQAGPEDGGNAARDYFLSRFPVTPFQEFANGVYAIDPASRQEWEANEEFPPYEMAVAKGEKRFHQRFRYGKTFARCFKNNGRGVKTDYPYFDARTGLVHTLESDINACLRANGEQPLAYEKSDINNTDLNAYLAYIDSVNKLDVKTPQTQSAIEAYNQGKSYFPAPRNQLNTACARCHVSHIGFRIRADLIGPEQDNAAPFPIYHAPGGDMGTLHRRFVGCTRLRQSKSPAVQSEEYRDLKYFLSYMGSRRSWEDPGTRQ